MFVRRLLARLVFATAALALTPNRAMTATVPLSSSLNPGSINLVFVVSEDPTHHAHGDINPTTANLTDRGLRRTLMMATYLRRQVLGGRNVDAIYVLEPMTHLQTAAKLPDLVAAESVEQFALLNQISLPVRGGKVVSANSYPLNATYAAGATPKGVATPRPPCAACQGLDFADRNGDNEALVNSIIKAGGAGFYLFCAPWQIIRRMMAEINRAGHYHLAIPSRYSGPDKIYAIAIAPEATQLLVYRDSLRPAATYPGVPAPIPMSKSCLEQPAFKIRVDAPDAASVPGLNRDETVYLIRHAEAHPGRFFEDGNNVCAGQWRALALPAVLSGKISPDLVYSVDPAQTVGARKHGRPWSYVRPALTVEPYAIANSLPFGLMSNTLWNDCPTKTHFPCPSTDFFFKGGAFSHHRLLVAWEHNHIPAIVQNLIDAYYPNGRAPQVPDWPPEDYDSIWTVRLDERGNLTVANGCEGIDSRALPVACPIF
jgi:hypothetical protein